MLHVDFETRSRVNLITDGGYNYATDPSTQVVMMAFAFDNDDPQIWIPDVTECADQVRVALQEKGHTVYQDYPQCVTDYILKGGDIAAHNAQFERLNFWYGVCLDYNIPEPPLEQFYCTATQARVNNMPAALGNCARALGGAQLKGMRGKGLIDKLSIPNTYDIFCEDTALYIEFAEYCIQDVKTERDISKAMRPLTDKEREDYVVSEIINDRGLLVDVELASAAVNYADVEQAELLEEIKTLSGGAILKARGTKLTDWVYARLDEEQQKHMHKYKDGEQKLTLDRNARARLMTDPDVPEIVASVVEASDFAQASSTAKFNGMLCRADPLTNRVSGAYVLFGASSTLRYSSRGLQLHNLPRDGLDKGGSTEKADAVRQAMLNGASADEIEELSGHSIMQTLKRLLRYSIKAGDGKTFVCGDWSQIEGRVAPWIAMGIRSSCDVWAQKKLDQYANQTSDYDVYCMAAEGVYGNGIRKSTHPNERDIGKVLELSMQFQGGAGAFKAMAVNYGVHVSDEEAERFKIAWRNANPWAPTLWKALEKAAIKAVHNPGIEIKAGRITYLYQRDINNGALWGLLPNGGVICYPAARVSMVDGKFGQQIQLSSAKAAWTPKQDETEWPRVGLYGGILAENVIQGTAAAILREGLATMVIDYEAPINLHTHDEMGLTCAVDKAEYWRGVMQNTMTTPPPWAEDLPLDVDIWTGNRYRK